LQKGQDQQGDKEYYHRHDEKSAPSKRLLAPATQPLFAGMIAAVTTFAVHTDISGQSLALLASGGIIVLRRLGAPGPGSFGQRRPANAVGAAVTGGDARFTAKAVDFAVLGAEQFTAREAALDCFAAADVTVLGHILELWFRARENTCGHCAANAKR
jgi:hypothetical protein